MHVVIIKKCFKQVDTVLLFVYNTTAVVHTSRARCRLADVAVVILALFASFMML